MLIVIGAVLMLCGGGCCIAEWIGGPDVFAIPEIGMSTNIFKMLLAPIVSFPLAILQELQKADVALLWYGLLLVAIGIILAKRNWDTFDPHSSAFFVSWCAHGFLISGLTGVVFHHFKGIQPMTVEEVQAMFSQKFIFWPWDVLSALKYLWVQYRFVLLIAGAAMMVFYFIVRHTEDHTVWEVENSPILNIVAYVVPAVYTLFGSGLIMRLAYGYDNPWQILKEHTFFAVAEKGVDFPFFRVISIFLVCAVLSFLVARIWEESSNMNPVVWLVILAGLMVCVTGAVLFLAEILTMMISSILSIIVGAIALAVTGFVVLASGDFKLAQEERVINRYKDGFLPVSQEEAKEAVLYMDADDPYYQSMKNKADGFLDDD